MICPMEVNRLVQSSVITKHALMHNNTAGRERTALLKCNVVWWWERMVNESLEVRIGRWDLREVEYQQTHLQDPELLMYLFFSDQKANKNTGLIVQTKNHIWDQNVVHYACLASYLHARAYERDTTWMLDLKSSAKQVDLNSEGQHPMLSDEYCRLMILGNYLPPQAHSSKNDDKMQSSEGNCALS